MAKYKWGDPLGDTTRYKIARNTFLFLFEKCTRKLLTFKEALEWVLRKRPTAELLLVRKTSILTYASVGDPYFEYLGYIRDNQFVQNK